MWFGVITLFPGMFSALTDFGITKRAVDRGLLHIQCWDPREFAKDKHHTVDDRPYGGGPGMLMRVDPLREAIHAARRAAGEQARVVYLSPQGQRFDQSKAIEVANRAERLILIAGRYKGIDERIITLEVDEEWSIGDYVLTGGELAVMVVIDAITRWIPHVLGHEDSAGLDSFADGLLECPQYTRPEVIGELKVPEVLLSGNHAEIAQWRLQQKLGRTWLRRKDLLEKLAFDPKRRALLEAFIGEHEKGSTNEPR